MTPTFLPPEDLPSKTPTTLDAELRGQLEYAAGKYFFQACGGVIQSLLLNCEWTISVAEGLMLVIRCPDLQTNWRVLNQIVTIADQLAQFNPTPKSGCIRQRGRVFPMICGWMSDRSIEILDYLSPMGR